MSWEISTTIGFISIAYFLLLIGLKGDDKALPLKLVMISTAIGFLLMTLTNSVNIVEANNDVINNITISQNLIATNVLGLKVLGITFWVLILVTVISFIFTIMSSWKKN